jgi:hypothetical protein
MKVVKLQEHELEQATEVMSDAFATDPLMLWVFGSKDKYFNYSKPVFKSWIKYTLLYGEAYRTENFGSVALIKLPGITDFSLWGLFRSGMIFNIFYLGFSGWNRFTLSKI